MSINAPEERLRAAGLRATRPRSVVLGVLTDATDHPRVDQVIERVRGRGARISVQAAYDACEALRQAGLARRIELPGSPTRYEARAGDNHHHLVCRGCGVTADVDCATGAAPCLEPSTMHGFAVDEAEVTYWGLCPACQAHHDNDREESHG
ncbi:MAG TPA: Fur family transcriptional regulator [Solirubrobacteraceae bacterium]|nr:Fur family transcriptional regulator [Solirubrobacteraceae bacterium]